MVQHEFKKEFGSAFTGMVDVDGYVALNASAAVVAASCVLPGMLTVTKTNTGEYTFVVNQAFKKAFPKVQFAATTAVDLVAQVTSVTVTSSATTVVVKLLAGATPTNPSAACGIYFHLRGTATSVSKY